MNDSEANSSHDVESEQKKKFLQQLRISGFESVARFCDVFKNDFNHATIRLWRYDDDSFSQEIHKIIKLNRAENLEKQLESGTGFVNKIFDEVDKIAQKENNELFSYQCHDKTGISSLYHKDLLSMTLDYTKFIKGRADENLSLKSEMKSDNKHQHGGLEDLLKLFEGAKDG